MRNLLVVLAVLLAACGSPQTSAPTADCFALETAQVGLFWSPAEGCGRTAVVAPGGSSTFLQVLAPELRPGFFVFYQVLWQVGTSGNRGDVTLDLLWENPWVDPDPKYPGRIAEIGAHYWSASTDLVDAGRGHSGIRIDIRSDATTPAPFVFALESVKPVYVPATQIGAFFKRTGLTVRNLSALNLPPQDPEDL